MQRGPASCRPTLSIEELFQHLARGRPLDEIYGSHVLQLLSCLLISSHLNRLDPQQKQVWRFVPEISDAQGIYDDQYSLASRCAGWHSLARGIKRLQYLTHQRFSTMRLLHEDIVLDKAFNVSVFKIHHDIKKSPGMCSLYTAPT